MTSLTWQTLALLAVTYFAGCCIGCLARRAAWRRRAQPALPAAVRQPAEPATVNPVASALHRSPAVTLAANKSAAVSTPAPREPFRRADAPAPQPAAEASRAVSNAAGPVTRFERALEAGGHTPARPDAVAAPDVASDDLKRIRAIDAALETRLKALGARTFAAIAQWTAADTARMSRELGFKGRIEQENWIEQAQILARGADTRYSQRLARGEAAAAQAIEDEGERHAPAAPHPQPPVGTGESLRLVQSGVAAAGQATGGAASSPNVSDRAAFAHSRPQAAEAARATAPARPATGDGRDDLQRIRGINMEMEALLNRQGVTRYAQITSWSNIDIGRLDSLLGQDGRIARENWIEQAQILAKGGDTGFSRDHDRRAADAEAQAGRQEIDERTGQAKAGRASDLAALRSVRSQAYRAVEDAAIGRNKHPLEPDDLKRIRGIGVLFEKRLNGLGVITYAQIANWTAADIDRVAEALELNDRIALETWIEQARVLSKEDGLARDRVRRAGVGELQKGPAATASESVPASQGDDDVGNEAARASDLAGLRSVRPQAFRAGEDAAIGRAGRAGVPNDLKRVRGIGLLIEKKLISLGVTTYEQIANWTAADIDRVSQVLDFKGRIERENWVEQARILASGGQTEFSRRVDRGAAATSRDA